MASRFLGPYKTDRLDTEYASEMNGKQCFVVRREEIHVFALVFVASWAESDREVLSCSETNEFPGRHSEAFC